MEENKYIKRLIQLYFGKRFSLYGRILFGRWLKSKNGKEQKLEVLQVMWNDIRQEATESTFADWKSLQMRLPVNTTNQYSLLDRKWLKYVAIIGFMLLTSGTTYWVTHDSLSKYPVSMAQIFVPYGENEQFSLPDGSKVWVDAGTLLVYPKDFDHMDTRTVYLTGQASFSVQKNPEQPFIVKTAYLDVQALGTVFTINAYPSDSCSMATLKEGKVLVSVRDENIEPTILVPDQQLVYFHQGHEVTVKTVDASLYSMESAGYLIFENTSFNHLMTVLERKFNVKIHYNSQKFAGEYYNVKFSPEEKLEDVLNILQQLVGIHYKIRGNVVFIN